MDRAVLSMDPLLVQASIDRLMGFEEAGLIGIGQVVRFIVALSVRVRWETVKSELHVWLL